MTHDANDEPFRFALVMRRSAGAWMKCLGARTHGSRRESACFAASAAFPKVPCDGPFASVPAVPAAVKFARFAALS
jgi:hypothetical protein